MIRDNELPVPFFSGLCLEGEVAGQYELEALDGSGDGQPNGGAATAGSTPELLLEGLGPIMIFVGANNSGKSRLMRELFSKETFAQYKLFLFSHGNKINNRSEAIASSGGQLSSGGLIDIAPIISQWAHDMFPASHKIQFRGGWMSNSDIDRVYESLRRLPDELSRATHSERRDRLKAISESMKALEIDDGIRSPNKTERFYIPILRGMRPPLSPSLLQESGLDASSRDLYSKRTYYDYFEKSGRLSWSNPSEKKAARIWSGLDLYEDLRARLLSRDRKQRQTVPKYEDFLSRQFFGGESVTLTPVEDSEGGYPNDVVYIRIGDKADYPIHELGDGMQGLIICTYPIVTETRRGCWFFLEEPDLCMHPSLQRTFLEVLKHYHRSMGHQFFLTTHSNHLLDLVDDPDLVSVLSFSEISGNNSNTSRNREPEDSDQQAPAQAQAQFRIRQAKRQDRDLLDQLGVRPSATFLANATVWVEGISDVAYLRVYMEAFLHYLKHWGGEAWQATASQLSAYKEDNHYAFVEYNGSNLEHFDFSEDSDCREAREADAAESGGSANGKAANAKDHSARPRSLCAQAIVIADGDIETKPARLKTFRETLKNGLIVLPGKEVENLIPEHYVKQQVRDDHTKPKRGQVSDDIIESISYTDYCRYHGGNRSLVGIGGYLHSLEIKKYGPSPTSGSQGTLPDTYKQRWRSNSEGIPRKIREALNAEPGQNDANSEDASKAAPSLPDYMTRDLIWLCTCIYSHIAQCNHHQEAHRQLSNLREWMLPSKDSHSESLPTECGEPADARLDAWPSHLPDARDCVLQSYATKASLTSQMPAGSS